MRVSLFGYKGRKRRGAASVLAICVYTTRAIPESMEQLFTFIGNHPLLVGMFVVLLLLFIRNEMAVAPPLSRNNL